MITVNGIKLLPDTKVSYVPNPKRRGSMACDRYEKYCKAKTVEDYFRIMLGPQPWAVHAS